MPSSPIRFSAGNPQIVVEHLVGVMIHHRVDRLDRQAVADCVLEVDQQDGQPIRAFLHLVDWCCAHEQGHQIALQGARGPDFLSVDDIMVAIAHGPRLELECLRSGRWLGDAEGLVAQLAGRDFRQVSVLLRLRAMPEDDVHHVHLGVAGIGVAAGRMDLLKDDGTGPQRQPGAAILFGNQRSEVARLGHCGDELVRKGIPLVEIPPVGGRKSRAYGLHAFSNFRVVVSDLDLSRRRVECHLVFPFYRPSNSGFLFSLKARTPSSRSSVPMVRP